MLAIHPYLFFNGQCEEAFEFYKSVFGGDFEFVGRYGDIPTDEDIPDSEKSKIMHISLPTKNIVLMGADTSDVLGTAVKYGNNNSLSITTVTEDETKRLFEELSEGGDVIMPLEETFWAKYYASFIDKFGVSWIINYVEEEFRK